MLTIARIVKSKLVWISVLVVVVVIIVAMSGKKPISIKVIELKPGELRVIVNATTTSTVKSETEVTLSAQRTGRVIELPVKEGDIVKAGTLIARLDLAEESVQTGNALAQSKATYEEAGKNLKRSKDLFNKGMISQQDFDAVRRTHDVAKSQYQSSVADADVKSKYSIVRAPFDGVVAKKATEVGELLLPGKEIATIVNPDRIYILATIDEVDVGRLKMGQPVTITVDAFPGEIYQGTIKRISPIVSGGKLETRTADVWVTFNEKQQKIKPGMSADVEILVFTLPFVLSVPSQAVIEREGKKQVFTATGSAIKAGEKAVAKLKPVEIGETNWSFTQVTKGLVAGEFVITTPEAEGLKDGAKVKIEQ
ncbi:MAG: efflux RND transporter periplasmic adaptor subunit [Nitrospirae bacterium]|nr:efflux RND transporter periplasmic adaptor subunit [Nitrospirota bacterium]